MKTIIWNFLEFFLVLSILFVVFAFLARMLLSRIPLKDLTTSLDKRSSWLSYAASALFGAVTPLCVCTTIPVFTTMLGAGMRTGVAVSFLLASPLVSVSAAALMAFLFGVKFALVYVACAVLFSILGGILVQTLGLSRELKGAFSRDSDPEKSQACCSTKEAAAASFKLFRDLFFPLLFGALIAGLIHNVVPLSWVALVNKVPVWALIPVMALIGFPIYANIMVLAPVAFVLSAKGLAPGAVMTFLMAGAGMSFPTAIVLSGILKIRLFLFYLGYTFLVYCLSGWIFSWLS